MTLSEWIENYCEENELELPDGIPNEKVALDFIIANKDGGVQPEGTINITENGVVDVTEYASANVNVESGGYESVKVDFIKKGSGVTGSLFYINYSNTMEYPLAYFINVGTGMNLNVTYEKDVLKNSKVELPTGAIIVYDKNGNDITSSVKTSSDPDGSGSNKTTVKILDECTIQLGGLS